MRCSPGHRLPTHPLEADDAPPIHTRTQARAPALPRASERPEGVSSTLWNDLHWLPADLVGINGAARGESIGLITWLRNQPEISGPACDATFAGIETAYGIEWAEPPQSFVVYGSFRREDFEACAREFLATMGGSLVAESDTTEAPVAAPTPQYAVPSTFGLLSPIQIQLGAPNESGIRTTVSLETPSLNSLAYEFMTCEA